MLSSRPFDRRHHHPPRRCPSAIASMWETTKRFLKKTNQQTGSIANVLSSEMLSSRPVVATTILRHYPSAIASMWETKEITTTKKNNRQVV